METAFALLRVSLFALMLVDVHGVPVKGSKSQGHGRHSDSGGDHGSAHQGSTTGYSAPGPYSPSGSVSKPVAYLGPPVYAQQMPVMLGSAGDSANVGSVQPVQAGYVAGASEVYPAGYAAGSFLPMQAGYAAIPPQSGTRDNLPEMDWVIAPQAFNAESNTPSEGLSVVGPQLSPEPSSPALQSGETSNVVKEAELGNYQQQTEEFGYPASSMGPGLGLPVVAMPGFGVGGFVSYPLPYPFPYSYPEFDYRLLYGLYPPGTYTTFSKEHEKGKDYYQTIHYLKEHEYEASEVPQSPGTGQQKVYPSVQQRS